MEISGGEFIVQERIRRKRRGKMATLQDITVAGVINLLIAFAFFAGICVSEVAAHKRQSILSKWYLNGSRKSPRHSSRSAVGKFVNLDYRGYMRFLSWMLDALRMPQAELIDHACLDSVVYPRIYIVGCFGCFFYDAVH